MLRSAKQKRQRAPNSRLIGFGHIGIPLGAVIIMSSLLFDGSPFGLALVIAGAVLALGSLLSVILA